MKLYKTGAPENNITIQAKNLLRRPSSQEAVIQPIGLVGQKLGECAAISEACGNTTTLATSNSLRGKGLSQNGNMNLDVSVSKTNTSGPLTTISLTSASLTQTARNNGTRSKAISTEHQEVKSNDSKNISLGRAAFF